MHCTPVQKRRGIVLLFFLLLFVSFGYTLIKHSIPAHAEEPGGSIQIGATGQGAGWAFDEEVTRVGRGADRARQLLWWVWSHPAIYTAPVLVQMWAVTRNIVYVFIVLVIIAFGIGIMLSRRSGAVSPIFSGISSPFLGVNVPSVFLKLGAILLYVMFSYVFVLGLIQVAEITMQFIQTLVGKDLFNVFFAGSGNIEANYTTFIGFRSIDDVQQESVRASLFIIRLTSFTYYVMAAFLIVRAIILWFLLVLSPFLALLMPFIFIRNIGWIWIGVFFQWLFYGPLMVLFVVILVNIWVAGIPYSFDFSRINTQEGQVYQTSINILYGGPAQTLSSGNSSNYIDTFAEYVIALIMLWVAMLLPWLLLRIFRDYCCSLLASGNATLTSIFDRFRQYPIPPLSPTPSPPSSTGVAVQLPFRQKVEETLRDVKRFEDVREISHVTTTEIARAMNLSVSSLKDVSRLEMDNVQRLDVTRRLNQISRPEQTAAAGERERLVMIRSELQKRASSGDHTAAALLLASQKEKTSLIQHLTSQRAREELVTRGVQQRGVYAPTTTSTVTTYQYQTILSSPEKIINIAQTSGVTQERTREVLQTVATMKDVSNMRDVASAVSQKTHVSVAQVHTILSEVQKRSEEKKEVSHPEIVVKIARDVGVSEKHVQDMLQSVSGRSIDSAEKITSVAKQTEISEEKVKNVVSRAQVVSSEIRNTVVNQTAQKVGVSETKVREVLERIERTGTVSEQTIQSVASKTGVSGEKIKEILATRENLIKERTTPDIIVRVAQETNVEQTQVTKILEEIADEKEADEQTVRAISKETGVPEEKVKEVVANRENKIKERATEEVIRQVARETSVEEQRVKEILENVSDETVKEAESVKEEAEKLGVSEDKVKQVVASVGKQEAGREGAAPIPSAPPQVSLEEYEDVKAMWMTHYREAPIPTSESIKTREEWLVHEEKKLTNIANLLTSPSKELRQRGLEQVAEILPFMLLGGFSDFETSSYINAKRQAAKQVLSELDIQKQAKEKAEKEMKEKREEEEGTLVAVGQKKKEEEETQYLHAERETPPTQQANPAPSGVKKQDEPEKNNPLSNE